MPGKTLKPIPKGKENSLGQLPEPVINKMGFTKTEGDTLKMKHGGRTCKGMRKANRGGYFGRNG
tara:strand:+ start:70 stop:261 length:192 start_codon:yes stop_codon:yes gene_type:complete